MFFRFLFALLVVVNLAGCNLTIHTTGEGEITAEMGDQALNNTCTEQRYCFNLNRGSSVTITASPAEGFVFAGWGGVCSGQAGNNCQLQMNSDRVVQASFIRDSATSAAPLWVPNTQYFFSAPWPSDLYSLNKNGTVNVDHFPFSEQGPFKNDLQELALQTKGFGLNSASYFQWDSPEWLSSLPISEINQLPPNQRMGIIINVDPNSPFYGGITPAILNRYKPETSRLDLQGLLAVLPEPGSPLLPSTRYAILLIRTDESQGAMPAELLAELDQSYGKATGIPETLFESLKQQKDHIWQVVSDHTQIEVNDILAFTQLTTQDPLVMDRILGDTIRSLPDRAIIDMVKGIEPVTLPYGDPNSPSCYQEFILKTELPNYITGTGLHILGGGRINTAEGKAIPQGVIPADLLVSVPCSPVPEEGFPLRAFASGTSLFWELNTEFEFQQGIHLWLNAPETMERTTEQTDSMVAFFEKYTDIDFETYKHAFIDFNFLNLHSAMNRHHQYAADIGTVLRIGKLLPRIMEQFVDDYGYDPQQFRFNPKVVTLAGRSLGAIAVNLAATQNATDFTSIATWEAIRPSYLHINNVIKLIEPPFDAFVQAYSGISGSELAQPELQLLQAVLEPMDIMNHINSYREKDIYWNLARYGDLLHGGDSSFSMAKALENMTGIRGINGNEVSDTEHLGEWLRSPILKPDTFFDPMKDRPLQLITEDARWEYEDGENTFRCFTAALAQHNPVTFYDFMTAAYYDTKACSFNPMTTELAVQ